MKSLPTLLKLAQRRIDALAVEAARAMEEIDALTEAGQLALQRQGQEAEAASRELAAAVMLPAYHTRLRMEEAARRERIAAIEETLARVREGMMAAYRERSKFEQLLAQAEARQAEAAAAREQAELDEAALNGRIYREG